METRPVPFAKDLAVSRCGRVFARGRERKTYLDDGYPNVMFWTVFGKRKVAPVHRLVALLWMQPAPDGMTHVRHKDGDRSNAHVDNLAWGNALMNAADRDAHGGTKRGEQHGRSVLTDADVVAIRAAWDGGETIASIAARYSMAKSSIQSITSRSTWRHVA